MLELKNVSKYYYTKNAASQGINKINLKLDINEFVVITGESGSGKSTLLNVISGLDTYEEGEMYIAGEETSGYTEKDFEKYRKKYIGNIFQSFNLINSYTVYQNIELVLLINGVKRKDRKKKIKEVLEKVELTKYKNTKVSKLSGGQKQRVAIARALVKDTPTIFADEPTGNLDVESANKIMELLYNVSKDKLVVIVTHNYEQVEEYATRKITMSDGKIIEDKKLKETEEEILIKENVKKKIRKQKLKAINKIRLGVRNTFNIKMKFILLFLVYLFVVLSVVAGYTTIKKQRVVHEQGGYNSWFNYAKEDRIIIKKQDNTEIIAEDYAKMQQIQGIEHIEEKDLFLDEAIYTNIGEQYYSPVYVQSIDGLKDDLDFGRMPENDKETVIAIENDFYDIDHIEEYLGFKLEFEENGAYTPKDMIVTGIIIKETPKNEYMFNSRTDIYVQDSKLNELYRIKNALIAKMEITFNDNVIKDKYEYTYIVAPNDNVPTGKAIVPDNLRSMTQYYYAIGKKVDINVNSLYYSDELHLTVSKTYTEKTIEKMLNVSNSELNLNKIYINTHEYNNMFEKGNYQSSVFVKDQENLEEVNDSLNNLGYTTLKCKDILVKSNGDDIFINVFIFIVTTVVITVLFFLSYFIIKLIMKSRNVYYSTIRILGATRSNAKSLLKIELYTILTIVYGILLGLMYAVSKDILHIEYVQGLLKYIRPLDLIILYAILYLISTLIAVRYAKQLFKKSAMNTYREEEE